MAALQTIRQQLKGFLNIPSLRCQTTPLLRRPFIAHQFFAPIWKQNKYISSRPSPPSISQTLLGSPRETSLAWVQLHDQTPAGYGVDTFFGYVEIIPPKTPLPCKATKTLESAIDYLRRTDIPVCYRTSMLHAPMQIANVTLDGLRIAKKEDTKMKVQMEIGKDLVGTVRAWDAFTRSTASVTFNGRVIAGAQGGDSTVVDINS
jgi:Hsp70 protein